MSTQSIPLDKTLIELLPDPTTDSALLPQHLSGGDNSLRMRHCRKALRRGIKQSLTDQQQQMITMHYIHGMKQSRIAEKLELSPASVSKTIKAGKASLKEYIQLYMDIFDSIENDLTKIYRS